jgi:TrmH family RNA methyltransferase
MITSRSNPRVKYVKRLQADRRFRYREQAFVVEGTRWLSDLARSAVTPREVYCTTEWRESAANEALLAGLVAPVTPVDPPIMAEMSDTETPPGVLAVVPMIGRLLPDPPSLLLILDAVANPGNLGTMLRTAAAAGVDGVLLGPGCVDSYNPKVVRGSMGAHLRLPFVAMSWAEIAGVVEGMAVWLAAAEGDVVYSDVDWRRPSALMVGSEAAGANAAAQALATGLVTIPMHDQTESLNAAVAAAVILFEAARQRTMHFRPISGGGKRAQSLELGERDK